MNKAVLYHATQGLRGWHHHVIVTGDNEVQFSDFEFSICTARIGCTVACVEKVIKNDRVKYAVSIYNPIKGHTCRLNFYHQDTAYRYAARRLLEG